MFNISGKELKKFLRDANKVSYASGTDPKILEDGSQNFFYEDKELGWKYYDSFDGGEPYIGRERIVDKDNKCIYGTVYYGWIIPEFRVNKDDIYKFLQLSLRQETSTLHRGPEVFSEGDYKYELKQEGDESRFDAKEYIYYQGKLAYEAHFMGGLVNQN